MKKRNLITVLMMTAALAAGCGAKAETTTAAPTQAETTKAETTRQKPPRARQLSLNRRKQRKKRNL